MMKIREIQAFHGGASGEKFGKSRKSSIFIRVDPNKPGNPRNLRNPGLLGGRRMKIWEIREI